MKGAASWTRGARMQDPVFVRKVMVLLSVILLNGALASPAQADQQEVDAARAAYKVAVQNAVNLHKSTTAKAQADYQQALRTPADPVAVANAQAKALADQATKASQAKGELERALADAGGDRKARAKAIRDYDAKLRQIQLDTEKALRDAKALGDPKTAREYAKTMRDQALRTAQQTLNKTLASALIELNKVLVANGLPPEKG